MRATVSVAALAMTVTLLGGCNVKLDFPEAEEGAELVWSGYLTEIDGEAVGPSGVRLDIYRDPNSSDRRLRYEVTNGCTAGGTVSKGGDVSPYENFQPCRVEDIPLIGRLNIIAPGSLPAPDTPARLTWNGETAQLTSVRGEAHFKSNE